MQELVFTPTDFVALVNQTLETAYPVINIEGELANFKISKNRWVYFDLKDEISSVSFFGTVYQLPGPLEDGMVVRVMGSPRLHPRFGFSVNMQSIAPVGEGALKKAADLLRAKLEKEGLFAPERKRPLPLIPEKVGLITAADSAAAADFIKIVNERFGGLEILLADVFVQGDQAPATIISAVEHFSEIALPPDVLVVTRGGGSAEDLAAFNDERVVRAIAASRIPTLVAIGHEVDVSLAELAADMRASTPTNAAQILVPDRKHELGNLNSLKTALGRQLKNIYSQQSALLDNQANILALAISRIFDNARQELITNSKLIRLFDPRAALRRGYAIVSQQGKLLKSIKGLKQGDKLSVQLSDGRILATTNKTVRDFNG